MRRFEQSFLFVVLPLLMNVNLAFASFFYNPGDYQENPKACYLAMAIALGTSVVSFFGFVVHDLGPKRTMLSLLAQGVALIFVFAGIYRGYGLSFNGTVQPLLDDGASALYFSIVTWTTLGYGDFSPPPAIRIVAAMQALVGYIFLGISVGLGTFLLCEKRGKPTSDTRLPP